MEQDEGRRCQKARYVMAWVLVGYAVLCILAGFFIAVISGDIAVWWWPVLTMLLVGFCSVFIDKVIGFFYGVWVFLVMAYYYLIHGKKFVEDAERERMMWDE